MSLPKFPVHIVISVLLIWTVEMGEVPSKKAGHQHDSRERRKRGSAIRRHNICQRQGALGLALVESILVCRKIGQDLATPVSAHEATGAQIGVWGLLHLARQSSSASR